MEKLNKTKDYFGIKKSFLLIAPVSLLLCPFLYAQDPRDQFPGEVNNPAPVQQLPSPGTERVLEEDPQRQEVSTITAYNPPSSYRKESKGFDSFHKEGVLRPPDEYLERFKLEQEQRLKREEEDHRRLAEEFERQTREREDQERSPDTARPNLREELAREYLRLAKLKKSRRAAQPELPVEKKETEDADDQEVKATEPQMDLNQILVPDPAQTEEEAEDEEADAEATDLDGDGIADIVDNFIDPVKASLEARGDVRQEETTASDLDGDGVPDSRDADMDGDGIENDKDIDADGDGIPDEDKSGQDSDGDGTPDELDDDIDGDGIRNAEDPEPDDSDQKGKKN